MTSVEDALVNNW